MYTDGQTNERIHGLGEISIPPFKFVERRGIIRDSHGIPVGVMYRNEHC